MTKKILLEGKFYDLEFTVTDNVATATALTRDGEDCFGRWKGSAELADALKQITAGGDDGATETEGAPAAAETANDVPAEAGMEAVAAEGESTKEVTVTREETN